MSLLIACLAAAAARTIPPAAFRAPHVRCAPPVCQQSSTSSDKESTPQGPPIALRCLDRQEILDRLNAVPAFAVVNGAEQLVAERDENDGDANFCRFYLEISEAQAAAAELRKANPKVAIGLSVAPLGTAFALSEWQETVDEEGSDGLLPTAEELDDLTFDDDDDEYDDDLAEEGDVDDAILLGLEDAVSAPGGDGDGAARPTRAPRKRVAARRRGAAAVSVRLQAAQAEVAAVEDVLGDAPVPPLLRRRNQREGPIPLFGSDALRFRMDASGASGGFESGATAAAGGAGAELLLPLFFRREDFRAAWAASGGAPDDAPPVQVTDLRTLAYQMQFDTSMDYRQMLLVAPVRADLRTASPCLARATDARRRSRRAARTHAAPAPPARTSQEPAIEFVRQQQAAEEAGDAPMPVELSQADAQGLIFGE